MVQSPGELVGPKLWLVPRYSETPGSIMRLGSILTDPENLESSLNRNEIPPIPEIDTRSASQAVRRRVQSELGRSNSFLVEASPDILALSGLGLGASASAGWHHDTTTIVDALDVSATVFIPSAAYMDEIMRNKAVQRYARDSLFGKSMYIVVGTATARKLRVREERSRGHHAGAGAHIEAPGALGQAEVSFEHTTRNGETSQLDIGEECDFAYRIHEFFYSKMRKHLKDRGNFTQSALFGQDGASDGDVPNTNVFEAKFEYFEEGEATIKGSVTIPVNEDE